MVDNLRLYWHPHEYGGANRVRVWRENWSGDQFEILTQGAFIALNNFCTQFNIPLVEAAENEERDLEMSKGPV